MTVKPKNKPKLREKAQITMDSGASDHKMAKSEIDTFRSDLLGWYDKHRRVLPWRAGRDIAPDPYHVWLSEIMLQQTVVAAVIPYFQKFVDKWPCVQDLAAAPKDEVMEAWAGLGYYSRARNLHACAQTIVSEYKAVFPRDEKSLKKLPGIGDYTSAAVRAIAFDLPAVVIDGNVDRVVARYFAMGEPLPDGKKNIRRYAAMLADGRKDRPGDFAQAMMDLGATICTPKSPKCVLCPLMKTCHGRQQGLHEELPRKRPKKAKPQRHGYIYWVRNEKGEILVENRPESGLLGGMPGLPTSDWVGKTDLKHKKTFEGMSRPIRKNLIVRHSFTHFDLELTGQVVDLNGKKWPSDAGCRWLSEKQIVYIGFPTVFRKFVRLMVQSGKRDENISS